MKILIVEDDDNKRAQLNAWIIHLYPQSQLSLARSLQSGVREIKSKTFDVILLDMTLPNYDVGPEEPGGGDTHNFGGRELLKQMARLEISTPVIVVTQFETFGKFPNAKGLFELDEQLRSEFRNYIEAVYYHASIHGWQSRLQTLLHDLQIESAR